MADLRAYPHHNHSPENVVFSLALGSRDTLPGFFPADSRWRTACSCSCQYCSAICPYSQRRLKMSRKRYYINSAPNSHRYYPLQIGSEVRLHPKSYSTYITWIVNLAFAGSVCALWKVHQLYLYPINNLLCWENWLPAVNITESHHAACLKAQCHEIFDFRFFSWISFPPAQGYPIRTVSNFFENSRWYSQLMVSLIPMVRHDLRISLWIFEKIRNDANVIFRGLVEDDSCKKPKAKNLVTLPLYLLYYYCIGSCMQLRAINETQSCAHSCAKVWQIRLWS